MDIEINRRLKGTRKKAILQELFMNTIHFPIAIVILELLLEGPVDYLQKPDIYALIVACLAQAYFLGTRHFEEKSGRIIGNLIAPAIYTLIELPFEGLAFFYSPAHLTYWGYACAIGLLQESGTIRTGVLSDIITIAEHWLRTSIVLVTYGIFEYLSEPKYSTLRGFFSSDSHIYMATVITLLGLVIGFTSVLANKYLSLLQETAAQLRKYSEWLLGKDLLSMAITDAATLSLKRKERCVVFIDIRGFTSWSENRTPEVVVKMLNDYFEEAEKVWKKSSAIKTKHTADEIMAVFPDEKSAVSSAFQLNQLISDFLKPLNLSAGIGVHRGLLVEGLIGSQDVKIYDIIGDTVNTSKRICDKAAGGELLISEEVYTPVKDDISVNEPRLLKAKGKKEPIKVYPVLEVNV
jgi:adenylate cyclase